MNGSNFDKNIVDTKLLKDLILSVFNHLIGEEESDNSVIPDEEIRASLLIFILRIMLKQLTELNLCTEVLCEDLCYIIEDYIDKTYVRDSLNEFDFSSINFQYNHLSEDNYESLH